MADESLQLPDWPSEFVRAVTLDDIRIRSGGSGRTVEAYAAVFDDPTEIVDQDGHYIEVNSQNSFTQTIAHHRGRFPVVYHHGMTLAGTPSDRGSVPIGVSTEVTPDKHGVLTVSEYGRSQLTDEVLEMIKIGAVTAQSYGGRFVKSDPRRPTGGRFRAGPDGKLRTVTRLEIAMREFGPTPFPAYANAAITGVRAQQMLGALLTAPADQRTALLNGLFTPQEAIAILDTPEETEDVELTDEAPRHSARSLSQRIRMARIIRGME
jgi:phage head maturation protease